MAVASSPRSSEAFERASTCLAAGVASSLRAEVRPTPLFVQYGEGAEIIDYDGRRLVDYTLAYGPLILGHAHPAVVAAASHAVGAGSTYGAQHDGEFELARRICEFVPGADLSCFAGSGTEAVMVALRLARAFTGRQTIIRFAGHYHGWSDAILAVPGSLDAAPPWNAVPAMAGQSPAALSDVMVLPWNDINALNGVFANSDNSIAAVICEPVLCNAGCIGPAQGFLQRLRELTTAAGALLIFDEVITGFRLQLGGAQERFGINADLAVFGKALSGGFPLSAVAGQSAVMRLISDGTVTHMGTLNGNPVCVAASIATVDELARNDGEVYARMADFGETLVSGLQDAARRYGFPLLINSLGQTFQTIFTQESEVVDLDAFNRRDAESAAIFARLLLEEGVFVRPHGLWYVSAVHEEQHLTRTLAAVDRAFERMR